MTAKKSVSAYGLPTDFSGISLLFVDVAIVAPSLVSASPSSGSVAGGDSVALVGSGFTGVTGVTVGGVSAAFTITDDTHMTITATPAGAALGSADIVITSPGGSSTLAGGFTYTPSTLSLTSISPNHGPATGATAVTLVGGGFLGVAAGDLTVDGNVVAPFTVVDNDTITFTLDGVADGGSPGGTPDIAISRSIDAQFADSSALFTYDGSAFSPLTLPAASGTAKVWYDAAHSTNTGGATPVLATLPDQSGNGCDAVIPAGNEPFFTAANAAFNNLPTMDFSPAADMRYVDTGDIGIATGAPFTYVLVADSSGTGNYLASARGGSGIIYGAGLLMSGDAGTHNLGDGHTEVPSPSVVVAVFDGVSSRYYINAKTPISTGNAGAQDLGTTPNRSVRFGMYAGGLLVAWNQDGSTAHALVYDGALSQADAEYLLTGFGGLAGIAIGP